jgi:hypothetical protein
MNINLKTLPCRPLTQLILILKRLIIDRQNHQYKFTSIKKTYPNVTSIHDSHFSKKTSLPFISHHMKGMHI